MQPLLVSPAINIRAGRAVQLAQVRPDGVELPARDLGDPVEIARRWVREGASRLMLIDADAAQDSGSNLDLVREIRAAAGVDVTLSGGLRDDAAVARAFKAGADHIQLGTGALESPEWAASVFARYGDRVAASFEVFEGELATHGRTVRHAGEVGPAVRALEEAGCRRFVVRCLASDGALTGPNYELLGEVCALTRTGTQAAVVVSGGIGSLEDLRRLRGLVPIGLEGVVVGTALYQGLFTIAEALDIAEGQRPLTTPLTKENA